MTLHALHNAYTMVHIHIIGILFYNTIVLSHKESNGLVMLQMTSCLQRKWLLTVVLNLYFLIHDNNRNKGWIWLVVACNILLTVTIVTAWQCRPFSILQMLGCESNYQHKEDGIGK